MQQLISHLLIICDNVYKENAFAVYDPNLFQFCTYSASHSMLPPLPLPARHYSQANNGYITDLDPHREQRGRSAGQFYLNIGV